MKCIILKGPKNTGKTTIIKSVFIELVKKYKITDSDIDFIMKKHKSIDKIQDRLTIEKDEKKKNIKGFTRDIKLVISIKGKRVLFYSAGDKKQDCTNVKECATKKSCDIIVCAWRKPGVKFDLIEEGYVNIELCLIGCDKTNEEIAKDLLKKIEGLL